ncbi:hypothetical protein B0T24DRAFT_4795 [Lasiosphaeria ovina]|uniref:Protein YAE1 n=1 Tax=Lasiosphaeria ovina TaxID=92902 RepID=A0AAE0NIS4_9PEZI|nr:hypothetical protein B0T24DRAFT_4795 [Lasiosphaeria ovina]
MLLRSPADAGPDVFQPMTSRATARTDDGAHGYHQGHAENQDTNSNGDGHADATDDVWGADDDGHETGNLAAGSRHAHAHAHAHPSDVPRLQQEHTTAGYRDGIAAAKGLSAQAGFDEGFGLGATIGARAGQLLGVLEGLAAAATQMPEADAARVRGLLAEARRELSVQAVFGEAHWVRDGTWSYDVPEPGPEQSGREGGGGGSGDVVFADVAAAHPLLRKWDGVVQAEAARYRIDWDVIPPADEAGGRDDDDEPEEPDTKAKRKQQPAAAAVKESREALAW